VVMHSHTGVLERSSSGVYVSILGFPNVGKSALFNSLTRGNVEVANWPGTTVEVSIGKTRFNGYEIIFVDMPGVYSLSEGGVIGSIIKSNLLQVKPHIILALVDGSNPVRSLNLAVQLLEFTGNVIVVITKLDLAHSRGIHINVEGLSKELKTTIVPTSIVSGLGLRDVLEAIVNTYKSRGREAIVIDYGLLEQYINDLILKLKATSLLEEVNIRWIAIKLLEGDSYIEQMLIGKGYSDIVDYARKLRVEAKSIIGRDPADLIVESRFKYTSSIASRNITVSKLRIYDRGVKSSYDVDKLLLNPRLSPIISLTVLLGLLTLAFTINTGFPLNIILDAIGFSNFSELIETYSISGVMESIINVIVESTGSLLEPVPTWLQSLIIDGIIGGVSAVLFFAPLILTVALILAILEDSGLAPRFATSLHPYTCRFGFSGHSIFPSILCLGCNVAGLMSLRAIPSIWERFKLYMLLPLIPCQARLIVFVALASALKGFISIAALIIAYIISFTSLAILSYTLDKLAKNSSKPILLIEIPSMHKPIPRVLWWLSWSRLKHFLVRAGTIIFIGALISWILTHTTLSLDYTDDPAESIAANISKLLAPLLEPLGIRGEHSWIIVYALITGFIAKELVLSSIVVATGIENPIRAIESLALSDASTIALIIIIALYTPCLATVATIYSESRRVKIAAVAVILGLISAYIASIIVYNILAQLIT